MHVQHAITIFFFQNETKNWTFIKLQFKHDNQIKNKYGCYFLKQHTARKTLLSVNKDFSEFDYSARFYVCIFSNKILRVGLNRHIKRPNVNDEWSKWRAISILKVDWTIHARAFDFGNLNTIFVYRRPHTSCSNKSTKTDSYVLEHRQEIKGVI